MYARNTLKKSTYKNNQNFFISPIIFFQKRNQQHRHMEKIVMRTGLLNVHEEQIDEYTLVYLDKLRRLLHFVLLPTVIAESSIITTATLDNLVEDVDETQANSEERRKIALLEYATLLEEIICSSDKFMAMLHQNWTDAQQLQLREALTKETFLEKTKQWFQNALLLKDEQWTEYLESVITMDLIQFIDLDQEGTYMRKRREKRAHQNFNFHDDDDDTQVSEKKVKRRIRFNESSSSEEKKDTKSEK